MPTTQKVAEVGGPRPPKKAKGGPYSRVPPQPVPVPLGKSGSRVLGAAKSSGVQALPQERPPPPSRADLATAVAKHAVGFLPVPQAGRKAKAFVQNLQESVMSALPKTMGLKELSNAVAKVHQKPPPVPVLVPVGSLASAISRVDQVEADAALQGLTSQVRFSVSFLGTQSPVALHLRLPREGVSSAGRPVGVAGVAAGVEVGIGSEPVARSWDCLRWPVAGGVGASGP